MLARLARAVGLGLALALLGFGVGGCGAAAAPPRWAWLRVVAEPPAASVYVNERFVGTARALARRPLRLRPGRVRLTVQAPGYFPHDLLLRLAEGTTTVRVRLRPVPP